MFCIVYKMSVLVPARFKTVHEGIDQEKMQSQRNSHSKNRSGKKLN